MSTRMRLRRGDGTIYLDRWGFEWKRLGGIFVHRMDGPDPGPDLHDHPWSFASLILKGGYVEKRANTRNLNGWRSGVRRPLSIRLLRLDEAHTITRLLEGRSWSLVIHGPNVRLWGFYVRNGFRNGVGQYGWVESTEYAASERGKARDLATEIYTK